MAVAGDRASSSGAGDAQSSAADASAGAGQLDAGGSRVDAERVVAEQMAGLQQLMTAEAGKHRSAFDEALKVGGEPLLSAQIQCRVVGIGRARVVVDVMRCLARAVQARFLLQHCAQVGDDRLLVTSPALCTCIPACLTLD